MPKYPSLLSPVKIGDLTLPNRVVMSPLTRGRSGKDFTANELNALYYAQRASAGLIISEGAHTSLMGRGWFQAPEIYTPEHAAGWKLTTDAVHAAGGKIFCQLWHTGRASHSNFRGGVDGPMGRNALPIAPSAIKKKSETGEMMYTMEKIAPIETPRAMTIEEVTAIPEEFRNAAQMAKDAGFDGVELHCASGYLLDTFLQSCSNRRDDEYGGSFENRFRLIAQVIEAIISVFGAGRVGVRFSPNGSFNGMGSEDNHEAFIYYAKRLVPYNVAFLHIVVGLGGFHGQGLPLKLQDFRDVYPGTIMANTGYTAESAETEICGGAADVISFGRLFITNPDLAERFASGAELVEDDPSIWWSEVDNDLGENGYTTFPKMT